MAAASRVTGGRRPRRRPLRYESTRPKRTPSACSSRAPPLRGPGCRARRTRAPVARSAAPTPETAGHSSGVPRERDWRRATAEGRHVARRNRRVALRGSGAFGSSAAPTPRGARAPGVKRLRPSQCVTATRTLRLRGGCAAGERAAKFQPAGRRAERCVQEMGWAVFGGSMTGAVFERCNRHRAGRKSPDPALESVVRGGCAVVTSRLRLGHVLGTSR